MKLMTMNHRTAGFMLLTLVLVGLLLIACQPAVTSEPAPEAATVVSTDLPPTSAPSTATPAPTSTATSVASPVVPRETENLQTESPQAATSVPSTSTPTTISQAEPAETREASADSVSAGAAGADTAGEYAGYDIRPIEEVSASGPPQVIDITDRDAVLVFESGVPLACSVVYGKTTTYGQISVDQDMNGGAHTDHHPLLAGLEPDTEYHYRVQGSAPNGTLYIGEDMTFRTLPVEETVEINLASPEAGARIVAASSNFGGASNDEAWGADSAIDGNRGTAWSSNGDGNDAFVEIELAQPAELTAVEVWTRSMSDGTAQIFAFTLTTDAGEILGPFALEDADQAHRFEVDAVARSLRLDVVDSSGGNTGLIEFAVYGTPVGN
jgi:hypothetical protein